MPAGRIADLGTLGLIDSTRAVELYVEGIQTTAGVSLPISIELIVGDRVVATDLVTVVVVSNTLVIGIDGSSTEPWLEGPNAKRGNGLWNSHTRNLIDEADPFCMTIYEYGPHWDGLDAGTIQSDVVNQAEAFIRDAGGGTTIAVIGWSRGAMIALWVGNELSSQPFGIPRFGLKRNVAFVGMLDPVDMSIAIPNDADIVGNIRSVVVVGPTGNRTTDETYNVDHPAFNRRALFDRITLATNETVITRTFYNASHGAIGGTPGFNNANVDWPDGDYRYAEDVENSIRADSDIRNGLRDAWFSFIALRAPEWYGFPDKRPTLVGS